jgi:hypothetical protein
MVEYSSILAEWSSPPNVIVIGLWTSGIQSAVLGQRNIMARKGAMFDARRRSTDNTPLNLLNTCVFVVEGRMASHANYGTVVLYR